MSGHVNMGTQIWELFKVERISKLQPIIKHEYAQKHPREKGV